MRALLSAIVEFAYNVADWFHSKRIKKFYSTKSIDLVIDVGSHKGEFISLIVDDQTPIFSFEPQSSVRDTLIERTKNKNVIEYFDCALSAHEGSVSLHLNNLTSTTSIMAPDESSYWMRFKKFLLAGELVAGTEDVRVSRLDSILEGKLDLYNNVLLKIDVEGAEGEVLRGAEGIFRDERIKFVQIESANYQIYRTGEDSSPTEILQEFGFSVSKRYLFPLLNFTDVVFVRR